MRLSEINSYACYYGRGQLAQLAAYELVILQADAYTPQEIAQLQAQGTRTLAYLSVGEVPIAEADPTWLILDPATNAPLHNAQWDTLLVDGGSQTWRQHLLTVVVPHYLKRGVTGLFLDTVDVQDRAPETRPGVVALIRSIREEHPEIPILVNRGFTILEDILAVADGVLFEAFTTYHDGKSYVAWEGADLAWTGAMVVRLREASAEMPLFALDYASPDDHNLRERAKRRAYAYGMRSFITTYNLDRLPDDASNADLS